MLMHQMRHNSFKGALTTEPFVDDNSQGILVSRGNRFPPPLLWSHIACCANRILGSLGVWIVSHHGNAKVAEQNLVVCAKEHVLRLDVAVDAPLVMGILQGGRNLLDVGDDGSEWKACPSGVPL